ncbi:MAG: ketoacyl-ACP synthase III [Alphaproteobacteria bacterium]|nr:ketoacyl-ACP synthase III [Alphaproteobacteria bacterium]
MMYRSQVVGCGAFLPETILTNHDLAQKVDTSDEWIRERSGIEKRHVIAANQTCSDLSYLAAKEALAAAGVDASLVDCIVVATTTPDHPCPATATRVQEKLGANRAFAFDVQAVCSGFVYAVAIADNFIRTGQAKYALVIGADTMSQVLDWKDRTTCVLFGDGAGALLLKAVPETDDRGVLSTHLFSDGNLYDALYVDNSVATDNQRGYIRMQGKEIFKNAVQKIGEAVEKALEYNKLTADDIDWFVPHQANKRIILGVSEKFNIPMSKVVLTIDQHANTSAASIPLALSVAVNDGRIKPGNLVLIEAMGGGLTWGSALIRW